MTSPQQPNQPNQSYQPQQQQVPAPANPPQQPVYGVPQGAAPVPPQYGAGAQYAWQSQGVPTTDGPVPGYFSPQMQSGVPAPVPAPGLGAVPELDPKQVQKWRWRWALRGVSAVLLVVTLVLGAMTAAETESMLYIMDPPIHAKHDNGVKDSFLHGRPTRQEYSQAMQQYMQWGWEQSPDWIAFCNKINRRALREFGLDPQKDLENRHSGDFKWVCSWNPGGKYSKYGSVPYSVAMGRINDQTIPQFQKEHGLKDFQYEPGTNHLVATGIPRNLADDPSICMGVKQVPEGVIVMMVDDEHVERSRSETCRIALELLRVK